MSDTISIKIKLEDAAKFAGETRNATVEIDGMGEAAARANRKSKDAGSGQNILQKAMGLTASKAVLVTAGLGLFAQALSVGTASTFSYIAALSPLVGLLGALPAGFFGAAQGAGALKLAFSGVGGALGGLHGEIEPKKFAALTSSAQQFVLELAQMKAPLIALQRSVQGRMFGGLATGLKAAAPALSALARPLAITGGVIGSFGERLGKLVGSKGFLHDLGTQAEFNNRMFRELVPAGLHIVDLFRQLMVASRPLDEMLVHMAGAWAKSWDAMASSGRDSGHLQAFFREVGTTLQEVVRGTVALFGALIHIGAVARKEVGEGLLTSLVRASVALDKWTKSGPGVQAISGYFKQVGSTLRPLMGLFGTLLHDFTALGGNGGLKVLSVEAQGLNAVAKAIGWIEKNVPGGASAITALATAFVVIDKLKLAALFGGITKAIRWMAVATGEAAEAEIAGMGIMEATGAAATGMWAAITGPVGLVVAAVALIGAGFYLLYTKVKWFHDAVNAVFSWIVGHWKLLLVILTGPIGLAVLLIVEHFHQIVSIVGTVISWTRAHWPLLLAILIGPFGLAALFIITHFNQIVSFVSGLPHRIGRAATGMWDGIKTAFSEAWKSIERTFLKGISWITSHLEKLPVIGSAIKLGGDVAKGIGAVASVIPGLANGGIIQRGGLTIVGEQGPELLTLPRAAQVTPLLRAPTSMEVRSTNGPNGAFGGQPIHIRTYTTIEINSRPVAEGVSDTIGRENLFGP